MTETLPEMKARHRAERRALVEKMAKERMTQTQAARRLGVKLTHLNNLIRREGIFWPVVRQGRQ